MASYIGRRKFLATLGGAAAWPLATRAQQATVPMIGILAMAAPEANAIRLRAIREGLRTAGYVEGQAGLNRESVRSKTLLSEAKPQRNSPRNSGSRSSRSI